MAMQVAFPVNQQNLQGFVAVQEVQQAPQMQIVPVPQQCAQPVSATGNDHGQLYQQLLPAVSHIMQITLENEFDECTHAVAQYIMQFRWQDDSTIQQWLSPGASQEVLSGRILEAFAHWVRVKTKDLDYLVEMSQVGHSFISERLIDLKNQLEQACYQSSYNEVLAEFLHSLVCELLGRDSACLGSALAGALLGRKGESNVQDILSMVEWPTMLLAALVRSLEELQARVCKAVMEIYNATRLFTYDDSKNLLMMFFQNYTVETTTGTLDVHDSPSDSAFAEAQFRVNLVDSFGCLMKLLKHLEIVCNNQAANGKEVALAVDFEGVKLSRNGALCLVQLTCSDDPTLVYVLDVHCLGARLFTMQTPNGTSMKMLFENPDIRKVWFDPRNDIDALYHQFGIMPRGIFDLQLAEVADRRNRGLNVHYVQGLYKCLCQCADLTSEQKVFAERINTLGKSLFEPQNGGQYEIFQHRPLNPVILVYAAHDSRYMLVLYNQYLQSIGARWVPRVLLAGAERGKWCLSQEYVVPGSEAPDF